MSVSVADRDGQEKARQAARLGQAPIENVALAGEARSAVACAGSTYRRYLGTVQYGTYLKNTFRDRVESRWQVGIQGFWSEGQKAKKGQERPLFTPLPPTGVGARDVSDVCAPAVHFITASKIKLGPDGMCHSKQAWQAWQA